MNLIRKESVIVGAYECLRPSLSRIRIFLVLASLWALTSTLAFAQTFPQSCTGNNYQDYRDRVFPTGGTVRIYRHAHQNSGFLWCSPETSGCDAAGMYKQRSSSNELFRTLTIPAGGRLDIQVDPVRDTYTPNASCPLAPQTAYQRYTRSPVGIRIREANGTLGGDNGYEHYVGTNLGHYAICFGYAYSNEAWPGDKWTATGAGEVVTHYWLEFDPPINGNNPNTNPCAPSPPPVPQKPIPKSGQPCTATRGNPVTLAGHTCRWVLA